MKKSTILALGLLAATVMVASNPASAAVEIGGANGWKVSTDGIVDFFATYASTTKGPGAGHSLSLLSVGGNESKQDERFGTGIGLLPSVIAFNVKAPTTNGVDSDVRVGIYPALQNKANASGTANRFDTAPNIDFREFFYTAKGSYGELLVGRALNLYQGKNILTDMTLLGPVSYRERHSAATPPLGISATAISIPTSARRSVTPRPTSAGPKLPSPLESPTQSVRTPLKPARPVWRQKSPMPRPMAPPRCKPGFPACIRAQPAKNLLQLLPLPVRERPTHQSAAPVASVPDSAASTFCSPVTAARGSAWSAYRTATSSDQHQPMQQAKRERIGVFWPRPPTP